MRARSWVRLLEMITVRCGKTSVSVLVISLNQFGMLNSIILESHRVAANALNKIVRTLLYKLRCRNHSRMEVRAQCPALSPHLPRGPARTERTELIPCHNTTTTTTTTITRIDNRHL
jgi:hypothetical protein